jgi:3-deoxy-D-manno-octulosonic-acid transferase
MYLLYNILLTAVFVLSLPYTLLMLLLNKQNMRERFGWYSMKQLKEIGRQTPIWFHAASMGEVLVIAPLIAEIKRQFPGYPVIVSTITVTGLKRAQELIPNSLFTFILPLDVRFMIKKVVRALSPRSVVIAETEIWPNFIRYARRSRATVIQINGTISRKAFQNYRLVRPLMQAVLSYYDCLLVKSVTDRKRFIGLGTHPSKVQVIGNIKFDFSSILKMESLDSAAARRECFLSSQHLVFIAGCTRPGEEAIILKVLKKISPKFPHLKSIIAPRHLDRLPEVETLLTQEQMSFCRKSRLDQNKLDSADIILLDTMGELSKMYAMADVAFIGGSLFDFGGHNPLEPAIFKVPVIFGPFMENNSLSAQSLLEDGGALQINDEEGLTCALEELLANTEKRKSMGQSAYQVIKENSGIVAKCVKVLTQKNLI